MSFPRHPHVLSTTNLMPQVTGINLPTLAERECIYFTPANEHLGQALEDEITAHKSTCLKLDLEQQLRASIEAQLCFERAKISEIEESYAACHIDLQRVIADNIELRCRIHALEKRNKTLLVGYILMRESKIRSLEY